MSREDWIVVTKAEALAAACARRPEIDAPFANACLSRALGWANNLAREAQ